MTEKKIVDLNWTLYAVTEKYPGLTDTLFNLGFAGVKNPAMRETHGKIMTIKAGCAALGIDPQKVKAALLKAGFETIG